MRHIVSILLCLCLLLSVGSALAEGYEYTGKGPIAEEEITLTILGANTSETGKDALGLPFYENLYKAAGVKPVIEMLDNTTYEDAVKPRLAVGTGLADIVRLPDMDMDMSYINSGLFIDLTELYEKYGINIKKALEMYGASDKDLRTPDGKIFYVPMLSDAFTLSHTLHVNMAWLKNLNLEAPKTLDEFYNMLVAFRDNDANGNGDPDDEIPLTVKRASYLKLMSCFFDIDLYTGYHMDADGNVQSSYTSENYRDYLTFMHKLYVEKLLDPEFASNSTDILTNYCSQDRLGSMYGYMTDGYTMIKSNPRYTGDPILLAVNPLESPYTDTPFYWGNETIAEFYGITRECKDPENAFKFLDFCLSGREQWIVDETDIALTCNHLPIPLIPESEYDILPAWMAARDKEIKPFHKNILQIHFYTHEDMDVMDTYASDIETYTAENLLLFVTGARSLDEFDDYVATLKGMGIDEVVGVYQRHFGK